MLSSRSGVNLAQCTHHLQHRSCKKDFHLVVSSTPLLSSTVLLVYEGAINVNSKGYIGNQNPHLHNLSLRMLPNFSDLPGCCIASGLLIRLKGGRFQGFSLALPTMLTQSGSVY